MAGLNGYDEWLDNHGNPGIDDPFCPLAAACAKFPQDCPCENEEYAELQYENNAAADIDRDSRG